MPTRKTLFWLLAAAVLYLIAWNIGSGWLYTLTAMLLAFPLASLILGRVNIRHLEAEIDPVDSACAGDSLQTRLTLTNNSRLPRFFISLECELGGSAQNLFFSYIKGRGSISSSVVFTALRRGLYTGADVTVRSAAPVGLTRSHRNVFCDNPLAVYPAWYQMGSDWSSGHWATGHMASSSLPSRRASSDYLGVRDYRSDDSPRSIHWRSTARRGQLSVVEYSRLSVVLPVFMVDRFAGRKGRPELPQDVFEAMVSAAASLVQREAANNRRFAIGSDPRTATGFKLGHGSDAAMLWLAGIEADSREPMDLTQALPWPEATPVLLLANHKEYSCLAATSLLDIHPHSTVIMFDARRALSDANGSMSGFWNADGFMDENELDSLAADLEAIGGRLLVIDDLEEGARCLRLL